MNTKVTQFIGGTKKFVTDHAPEILTGIGITSLLTTTILAVKATPKALQLIEAAEEEKQEPLTKVEVVKAAWKPYVPAVITAVTGTACLIGASRENVRRNAALATAYQVVSTTLNDYKEQVVETIGEKKEKGIREKVAQKQVDRAKIDETKVFITGDGETWFIDPITMRPFKSDIQKVKQSFLDLNERMITGYEEYISLSEWYDEVNLARTSVSDDIGWNLGMGGQIKADFHATTMEDGRPALMIEFHVAPRRGFEKLM